MQFSPRLHPARMGYTPGFKAQAHTFAHTAKSDSNVPSRATAMGATCEEDQKQHEEGSGRAAASTIATDAKAHGFEVHDRRLGHGDHEGVAVCSTSGGARFHAERERPGLCRHPRDRSGR